MCRRWTQERFENFVSSNFDDRVSVVGKYVNNNTAIKIHCNICGTDYESRPVSIKKNPVGGCPKCYKEHYREKRTKSPEQFKREIFDLVGNEYTFLEDYKNALAKILCRHNKCGYTWEITPNSFLDGTRCPKCGMENFLNCHTYTQKEFDNLVKRKLGSEFEFLEPYKGTQTNTLCKHTKCGYVWSPRPNDLFNGHGCPKCCNQIPWTTKRLIKFTKDHYHGEYTILGECSRATDKVLVRHEVCGHEWKIKVNDFVNGHGCPKCACSKGEAYIERWLENHGISFESQKIFPDCVYKRPLRFDFYINDINLAIEYDGKQHFQEVDAWHDIQESLAIRKKRDSIKNDYCKKNKITLLRIPYTVKDNEIGEVLAKNIAI